MGGKSSKQAGAQAAEHAAADDHGDGADVILNVYAILTPDGQVPGPQMPGFGVWHSGVEVYDTEYCFGARQSAMSGVDAHRPRKAPQCEFKESIRIGRTKLSRRDARALAMSMGSEYPGNSYHPTGRNCNHFSEDFCQRLCGAGIPGWVNRAARVTNAVGLGRFAASPADAQQPDINAVVAPSTLSAAQYNLTSLVDSRAVQCLNEAAKHTLSSILTDKPARGSRLRSDCDPQLLLSVGFLQPVRLTGMVLRASATGAAPKRLLLYVNRPQLDFGSVEAVEPSLELCPTEEQLRTGALLPLPPGIFRQCSSVQLFVTENQHGEERTEIERLAFVGAPVMQTDMSRLKPVQSNSFYDDAD